MIPALSTTQPSTLRIVIGRRGLGWRPVLTSKTRPRGRVRKWFQSTFEWKENRDDKSEVREWNFHRNPRPVPLCRGHHTWATRLFRSLAVKLLLNAGMQLLKRSIIGRSLPLGIRRHHDTQMALVYDSIPISRMHHRIVQLHNALPIFIASRRCFTPPSCRRLSCHPHHHHPREPSLLTALPPP